MADEGRQNAEATRRDPIVIDVDSTVEPGQAERRREDVRARLASHMTYAVIGISLLTIGAVVVLPDRMPVLKEFVPIIFTGLFAAYGTIIGFYFGERR